MMKLIMMNMYNSPKDSNNHPHILCSYCHSVQFDQVHDFECSECGHQIRHKAKCDKCGMDLSEWADQGIAFCHYCGTPLFDYIEKKCQIVKNKVISIGDYKLELVYVPAGTFWMGATEEQDITAPHENDLHLVTLTNDYFISKYPITRRLWQLITKEKTETGRNTTPITSVNYMQCVLFCEKLNDETGLNFRLPTEAEWEYAARGAVSVNQTRFSGGNSFNDVAWNKANSDSQVHEVGNKNPNSLGIFDMSGNVWEWCLDSYCPYIGNYHNSVVNPLCDIDGKEKVLRGGSFKSNQEECSISYRSHDNKQKNRNDYGFRIILPNNAEKCDKNSNSEKCSGEICSFHIAGLPSSMSFCPICGTVVRELKDTYSDELLWQAVIEGNATFEEYLKNFPDGIYADEATYKKCKSTKDYDAYIARFKNPKYVDEVRNIYPALLEQEAQNEEKDFNLCTTKEQLEEYINTAFEDYRRGRYVDAAKEKIGELESQNEKELFEKCKKSNNYKLYLEKFPDGQYVNDAKKRIIMLKKKHRRRVRNAFLFIIIVLLLIVYFNWKPVKYFEIQKDRVEIISKEGCKRFQIPIQSDGVVKMVVLDCPEWVIDRMVRFNPDDERSFFVEVSSYSTIFGVEYEKTFCDTIQVFQQSGLAKRLIVDNNPSLLNTDKYGSEGKLFITTDGTVVRLSAPGWVHLSDTMYSLKYNNYEVTYRIDRNDDDFKESCIYVVSGKIQRKLTISQESGLASRISTDLDEINSSKYGGSFNINVYTDGTSWTYDVSDQEWIKAEKQDNQLNIVIESNKEFIRDGAVNVYSNNEVYIKIPVHQDGNPTEFGLSRNEVRIYSTDDDYETITFTNNSDLHVSVSPEYSWIIPSIRSGSIRISCRENNESPRKGNLILKIGDLERTIIVKQDGWVSCKICNGSGKVDCDNGNYDYYPMFVTPYRHQKYAPYYDYNGFPQPNYITCPTCNGSYRMDCRKCLNGKVKISYDNWK